MNPETERGSAVPRHSRSEVIDPAEVNIVHTMSRTVRRHFLLGEDSVTGKNFSHRKVWIEELLEHFAAHFAVELLCYAIQSNHYHLILRTRPDAVESWDDKEVARRWLMICPKRRRKGKPAKPTKAEMNAIRNNPDRVAEIRERLSSVSWWMRLINQRVAQRANREDGESGHFWQGRYRATRLIDEESLLACAAYVDLNPIRAAIAETIEASDYTSVQRRIDSELEAGSNGTNSKNQRKDGFLAKLAIDETKPNIGHEDSCSGRRCSDKGFLAMAQWEYFELLDWTARQLAHGKLGVTPSHHPPVLERLGFKVNAWSELVKCFDQVFSHVAGRSDRLSRHRSNITRRSFSVRSMARRLLPPAV